MQEVIDYYGLEYPAQVDSKTLADLSCLFSVRVQDLKTAIKSFRFPELYSSSGGLGNLGHNTSGETWIPGSLSVNTSRLEKLLI